MSCKQRFSCKVLYTEIQGFCKGLDKGTTAGGAGFVQLHAVYGLVLDLDTFHVLTADIQDTVYLGVKECSSIVMCHSFHFAVVEQESCFHQSFAVTGGAGAHDFHILRKKRVNFFQRTDGCM